jgi:hypothetical protein
METDHSLARSAEPSEPNDLSLWAGDLEATTALFTGDAVVASAEAGALAQRLSGAHALEQTIQVLATSLAVAKVQESGLAALAATLTRKKDLNAALTVTKLLRQASERVAKLAAAHASVVSRATTTTVIAQATHTSTVSVAVRR